MSKRSVLPQNRRHILIYDEDWDYLVQNYGPGSHGARVGISGAIRAVLHQRVLGMKARANNIADKLRDDQRSTGDDSVKLPV